MKLLRNREFLKELLLGIGLAALGAALCFVFPRAAGWIALGSGGSLVALHLWFTYRRYAAIAALSHRLDRILHDEERVLITGSNEGELSILSSEIQKMTVRLTEQTDRLAADKVMLTDAIADIFHQIRTPLTSINLGLAMLRETDLPEARRVELTRGLLRQTERIRWLVETLLKLSKIDAGTARFAPQKMAVQTLLARAAEPFAIPMELKGVTLALNAHDASVTCDAAWTTEAIGNLLKNAMEHTPAGGAVRIEAVETPLYTELVLTDTGEGFDPADLGHIFERYYKGKNATPDSIGIGLAFTREVLAAQGATITAANLPDGGARFTVRFYKSVV